jgi:hypothetical protein
MNSHIPMDPRGVGDGHRERSQASQGADPAVRGPRVARGRVIGHPRSDYDPRTRRIKRISAKSGKVRTPVPRLVSDALEVLLPHDATRLIVNSRGRPWTPDGFRVSVFKLLGALEEEGRVGPGLTVHGLRHTVAPSARGRVRTCSARTPPKWPSGTPARRFSTVSWDAPHS